MSIYTILNPINQTNQEVKYAGIQIQMNHHQYDYKDCILSFSGTIYNASVLCHIENMEYVDVESTIISLYKKYGMDHLLVLLDGVFAFVLYDYSINLMESRIFVVRSASGLIPLCIQSINSSVIIQPDNGTLLTAGTYAEFMLEFQVSAQWQFIEKRTFYVVPKTSFSYTEEEEENMYLMKTSRDICIQKIFHKFRDFPLFVLADTEPYSIYMTKQMDAMGIEIVESPGHIDDISGIECLWIDIRDMTFLSCVSSEMSEIGQDRICRGYLTDLQDSIARGGTFGQIQYPFLDTLWIEFYMTIPPKWRKRIFE